VVGTEAQPDEQSAAQELARYVSKATGAALPISHSAAAGTKRILVGPAACSPDVRDRVRRLRRDGFLIQADADSLILAGNGRKGTSFAVYSFLERALGVRWLWPGEAAKWFPSARRGKWIRKPQCRSLPGCGATWDPAERFGVPWTSGLSSAGWVFPKSISAWKSSGRSTIALEVCASMAAMLLAKSFLP